MKEIHMPGLWCPRCGQKGFTYQVKEIIQITRGPLDFPHYRCQSCAAKWYDASDVIALVVSYQFELPK